MDIDQSSISNSMTLNLLITLPNQDRLLIEPGREYLIGRMDLRRSIIPDIDLTPFLKNPLHVSRQQAALAFSNGHWYFWAHPTSSSSVFIGEQRLEKNQIYEIQNGIVVKFGEMLKLPETQLLINLQEGS